MFTGIIETTGTILEIKAYGSNKTFVIASPISSELNVDQSVSHDGVCLTVEKRDERSHEVTLIKETLERSCLGAYKSGSLVNLERCIRLENRLDGHMVQGHVDVALKCNSKQDLDGSWTYHFELPAEYRTLIVHKGSICINGISLTVSELELNSFAVSIIPYTYEHTNLSEIEAGDYVNVEFDILGKYVQRHLLHQTDNVGIK